MFLLFSFLFFSANKATTGRGNDFAAHQQFNGKLNNNFISSFSVSDLPHFYQCSSETRASCTGGSANNNILPFPGSPSLFVDSSKTTSETTGDFISCGNSSKECKTIKYSLSRWNPFINQPIKVYSNTFTESELDIKERKIILIANVPSSPPSIITSCSSSPSSSFISISTGELEMSYFGISHNSFNINNRGSTFLSISSSGKAKLEKVKIKDDSPSQSRDSFSSSLFFLFLHQMEEK
jgi:hypothetical protein